MAATGVFPMSAVIFRIFLVCQSLRVECASEQLITYICQLRPKTMPFQAVITRIIIWTSPRKVSVFGIFDIFVFMTPGRVLSTSPRFKIVRVLSSWNSLATTEVTLVLTVSKTCSGLPSVAQESWMTVTANRCWRNFVVDFSGLIISSSTLLRKFHGYNPDILLRVWEIPSQSHDLLLMMTSSVKFCAFRSALEPLMWSFIYSQEVFDRSTSLSEKRKFFQRQNSVRSSLEFKMRHRAKTCSGLHFS